MANSGENGVRLRVPNEYNPRILVFDYGAGTCDISILELSLDHHGVSSKNIAISRFEKCGGDDIDRFIATHYLFPQILEQNKIKEDDFLSREKNNIINHLLKPAELLKIEICKKVSLEMKDGVLTAIAQSDNNITLNMDICVDSTIKPLTLKNPKLSYYEFNEMMKSFLLQSSRSMVQVDGTDDVVSIFSPIKSAIEKASISHEDIDYVLLIGGSSNNPYVQFALKEYFKKSKLLIPNNLQTHVSQGAAIHSLLLNGFGKNLINPITSEKIFVITKDGEQILLPAGQQIPCGEVIIDNLTISGSEQDTIELPICVGSKEKILQNLVIKSENVAPFKSGTRVVVAVSVTVDKLLHVSAFVNGRTVSVEPLNPFANKPLTADERIVLRAQRELNNDAARRGGTPSKEFFRKLADAYKKVGRDFEYAETLVETNKYYPGSFSDNSIGVAYSNAGIKDKAKEYYKKDYLNRQDNPVSIFNYAHSIKYEQPDEYESLMKKAIEISSDDPVHLFDFGRWKFNKGDRSLGMEMIHNAMYIWEKRFSEDKMHEWDYSWYASAARMMGDHNLARKVESAGKEQRSDSLYQTNNLTSKL